MTTYEITVDEKNIESEHFLEYIKTLQFVSIVQNKTKLPAEITLASEKSLSCDWLLPEEDLIWQNL